MLPRLGSIPLRELTPDVVNRFRLELEADGVGPASIRKSLVLLQGVLQRACEWGRWRRTLPRSCASRFRRGRGRSCRSRPSAWRRSGSCCSAAGASAMRRSSPSWHTPAYGRRGAGAALGARPRAHAARRGRRLARRHRGHQDRSEPDGARPRTAGAGSRRVAAARRTAAGGRAALPRARRKPWTATAYRNWRRRIYAPAAEAAGVERPAAVRPAPLVRVAADRRGTQRGRRRAPGRALAEGGARHLRARLRGVRSGRADQRRRPHPARRARSCASGRSSRRYSTSRDRRARHVRGAAHSPRASSCAGASARQRPRARSSRATWRSWSRSRGTASSPPGQIAELWGGPRPAGRCAGG